MVASTITRYNSVPIETIDRLVVKNGDGSPASSSTKEQSPPSTETLSRRSGRTRQMTAATLSPSETTRGDNEQEQLDTVDQCSTEGGGSRRWGRGIVDDFRQTIVTHWIEEMTNLNQKTVAVTFFLYFACIAPAITFGAVYAKATNNWIGPTEMILATAWCGITYALAGGQPIMINGGTGPVLAFTEILYRMSESMEIPFLTFNGWIGIWVCVYMCIAALVDLNSVLAYATRFTDEIFSFLIATIFIINALGSPFAPIGVWYYFHPDHQSHAEFENDEDYSHKATALLSLLLCLGTVELSFFLRKIKFTPFLPNQMLRNAVTDFAVITSIVVMSLLANLAFSSVQTETLSVPGAFAPTYACCTESCETYWPEDCLDQSEPYSRRSWLVSLGDLNGKLWVPIMAAGPAALAFILVFLDDGITWHLLNHPMHKLRHGEAYDYDTLILGLFIAVNSFFGLPWLVAATVRSLNHVHALAEKTPESKIVSVQETRLTSLGIHLLCLASIFALDVLKLIPVPVLYGVFLFMGLVSLGTNTFWQRCLMLFMQPSKLPSEPFTTNMTTLRMHLFTFIQLTLFVLLYVVKSIKTIALAFPIIIALCIPIRLYLLPKIFTEEELVMIDSDESTVKAWLSAHKEGYEEVKDVLPAETGAPTGDGRQQSGGDIEMQSEEKEVVTIPRRIQRYKSVSCPPHMLFAEIPTEGLTSKSTMEEEEEEEAQAMEVEGGEEDEERDTLAPLPGDIEPSAGVSHVRRRRHTHKKSLSCPAHMLFAEAERQISSNYFFG